MINSYPIIKNGVVINVIRIDDTQIEQISLNPGESIGPLGGRIKDTWNGTSYVTPTPTVVLTVDDYVSAIEGHLDATALSKGYGNSLKLTSYFDSTVPQWKAEASAFVTWRDQVWVYAYDLFAQVQAGQTPPPATTQALIDSLPTITWP